MTNLKKGCNPMRTMLIGCSLLFLLLGNGCAKTVTVKDTVGDELQISLTFRSPITSSSLNDYHYYVVFSKAQIPNLPILNDYVTAPGRSFDDALFFFASIFMA